MIAFYGNSMSILCVQFSHKTSINDGHVTDNTGAQAVLLLAHLNLLVINMTLKIVLQCIF